MQEKTKGNNPLKIEGLQFIRLLAFILIFLSHSIGKLNILGALGVSIFLVMSGFLMTYNYYDREIKQNVFVFATKKISTLYPIHIAFMFVAIVKQLIIIAKAQSFTSFFDLLKYIICNVLLIQAWIPKSSYYFSLNAVSWYLSLCFFLYLVFPVIIKLLKRIKTKRAIVILISSLFILEMIVSLFAYLFAAQERDAIFSMHWLTYVFPISRMLDFLAGCCLGIIMINYGRIVSEINSLWSILVLLVLILVSVLMIENIAFFNFECIKYSLVYLPISLLLIYTFSGKYIIFCKLINSKLIEFMSCLTPYAFLMHVLILQTSSTLIRRILGEGKITLMLIVLISLAITMFLSWIYKKQVLPFVLKLQKEN